MGPWLSCAAAVLIAVVLFTASPRWRRARRAPRRSGIRAIAARVIERRFGGYKQALGVVDASLPWSLSERALAERPRVLVVGAGLAGIGVACDLSERGFRVVLREANGYLGGKLGAWRERDASGTELSVEHGFHAFFRQYYNLNAFLDRTSVREHLTPVDDYLILTADGGQQRFGDIETTPYLNLLALMRKGLFRLRDLLFTRAIHEMDVFLGYDREATFRELDHVSYAEFARRAELPERLQLVFNTFARSFFADRDRMSMAELVKSFHFYYLSHDHGLLYDYPAGSYEEKVLAPLRAYMEQREVSIQLGRGCAQIEPRAQGGYLADDEVFDYVVLATSAVAATSIVRASPRLSASAPKLAGQLETLRPGQRYAVLRLWITRALRPGLPVFVSMERRRILDSVTQCHRISDDARAFTRTHAGGAVLELHSYALPEELQDAEVQSAFMADLLHYFPELHGQRIVHELLTVRRDFTAFHVGAAAQRPGTECELAGFFVAGDWVKLPCPAMLMEAAYTSGLLATNLILRREGLRTYPVHTVPLRGLLADVRQRKLERRSRAAVRTFSTFS